MRRRGVLKAWADTWLRKASADWLFLHQDGEYQYRRPDSVYVHKWETFSTREDALAWLDRCVAKGEQSEWRLYRLATEGPNALDTGHGAAVTTKESPS